MAMSSGVYGKTLLDALANATALDLSGTPDTIDWQFVTDAEVPNYDDATDPVEADITTEASAVSTAGTYTLGGEPLVSPSLSLVTQYLKFDDSSDVALTGTTISAEGVIGFDDTIASPVDPLLWGTDFTSTYTSTAGAFNITWSADGIWRIALY